MKIIFRSKLRIAMGTLLLSIQTPVLAFPPYMPDLTTGGNLWHLTVYDDSSLSHSFIMTLDICFYDNVSAGTHQHYDWVSIGSSPPVPYVDGRAAQEGDQVFMHGDTALGGKEDSGHTGMEWQLTTSSERDEGFGHLQGWSEDGPLGDTVFFANIKLTRDGYCKYKTVDEALKHRP